MTTRNTIAMLWRLSGNCESGVCGAWKYNSMYCVPGTVCGDAWPALLTGDLTLAEADIKSLWMEQQPIRIQLSTPEAV
jgi:hypothetical protein